ncbi:MAG: NUDIX domain-containing protein [Clostridiales bacterium]|nr:NUDIX domain-containing protein [Clostridiales bacterium]
MGYIMNLRKYVGHQRLLMVGAGVFIYQDGQLLLQRRKDNGLWGDHGGSVELSEKVEDAARRELKEETGLTALSLELMNTFSGPEFDYTYPNGDQVSMVIFSFLCRDFEGNVALQQEEVTELKWFSLDELPGDEEISPMTLPQLKACLAWLKKEREK